ncbi:MAG TPA: globin domain-containing protein [Mycobacteriales bacterium]|nr:globin domain-containing protein [Mycobacteriales bacterium]
MSRDAQLIKESWVAVEPHAEKVAKFFYAHVFHGHPEIRDMFPVVMDVQRSRLLRALVRIVQGFENPEFLMPYLNQLGKDHRKFAVAPAHYDVVGASLIAALKEFSGETFTPEVEQAWARAYGIAARMMIDAAENAAVDEPPWWTAQVVGHESRGTEIAVITVRLDQPYPYLPGQFVAVESARRPRLWRAMSIANAPRPDGSLELHVKAVPGGWVSRALVHHTDVGDSLRFGPPMGSMVPNPSSTRNVLCVAGSTGLAPIRAIVEDMTRWNSTRNVHVFFGARSKAGLYDLEAMEKLAAEHSWLTVVPAVSDDTGFIGELGNVTDVFAAHGSWDNHDVFAAGSAEMIRATLAKCHELRIPLSRVRYDSFSDL